MSPGRHARRRAPAHRQIRTWQSAAPVLAPATVAVLVALTHLWLIGHMRAPIVQADEFGYLYGAHFLALGGPTPATAACTTICSAAPYYPGYSLLLAPLWLASHNTSTVYHGALDVNTALAVLSAWGAYVLAGRLAPRTGPWTRALVALVVAAYPSYLGFGNLAESENLLIPAWLGTCILADRAFARRAAGRRAGPTWAGLGLAGGLMYMVHPSALAASAGVAVVGSWVAISPRTRPWSAGAALSHLGCLVGGLAAGLVTSHEVIAYVGSGGPSNTAGFFGNVTRLASPHGLAHLGVNLAGQLLYLLAVTGGLVVLAVPLLARGVVGALGDRFPDVGRPATLTLIAATSVVMLVVSVLSLGTGGVGRLDITIYGRYNESVLAPVLVVGALVGIGLCGRGARGRIGAWALPGGIAALVITAAAVIAARGNVLRGTPQATNVLAAHALFRASAHSSLSLPALAGLGAAVLIVVFMAFRLNIVLAAAILVATFVPSSTAVLSDISTQSANVAAEQAVPRALVALGVRGGCVAFDTAGAPPDAGFAYFDFRLYDPTQSFQPFDPATGGRPCSDEVVSGIVDLASRYAGAAEVVADPTTGEELWILRGALQERLVAQDRLLPPGE